MYRVRELLLLKVFNVLGYSFIQHFIVFTVFLKGDNFKLFLISRP